MSLVKREKCKLFSRKIKPSQKIVLKSENKIEILKFI